MKVELTASANEAEATFQPETDWENRMLEAIRILGYKAKAIETLHFSDKDAPMLRLKFGPP